MKETHNPVVSRLKNREKSFYSGVRVSPRSPWRTSTASAAITPRLVGTSKKGTNTDPDMENEIQDLRRKLNELTTAGVVYRKQVDNLFGELQNEVAEKKIEIEKLRLRLSSSPLAPTTDEREPREQLIACVSSLRSLYESNLITPQAWEPYLPLLQQICNSSSSKLVTTPATRERLATLLQDTKVADAFVLDLEKRLSQQVETSESLKSDNKKLQKAVLLAECKCKDLEQQKTILMDNQRRDVVTAAVNTETETESDLDEMVTDIPHSPMSPQHLELRSELHAKISSLEFEVSRNTQLERSISLCNDTISRLGNRVITLQQEANKVPSLQQQLSQFHTQNSLTLQQYQERNTSLRLRCDSAEKVSVQHQVSLQGCITKMSESFQFHSKKVKDTQKKTVKTYLSTLKLRLAQRYFSLWKCVILQNKIVLLENGMSAASGKIKILRDRCINSEAFHKIKNAQVQAVSSEIQHVNAERDRLITQLQIEANKRVSSSQNFKRTESIIKKRSSDFISRIVQRSVLSARYVQWNAMTAMKKSTRKHAMIISDQCSLEINSVTDYKNVIILQQKNKYQKYIFNFGNRESVLKILQKSWMNLWMFIQLKRDVKKTNLHQQQRSNQLERSSASIAELQHQVQLSLFKSKTVGAMTLHKKITQIHRSISFRKWFLWRTQIQNVKSLIRVKTITRRQATQLGKVITAGRMISTLDTARLQYGYYGILERCMFTNKLKKSAKTINIMQLKFNKSLCYWMKKSELFLKKFNEIKFLFRYFVKLKTHSDFMILKKESIQRNQSEKNKIKNKLKTTSTISSLRRDLQLLIRYYIYWVSVERMRKDKFTRKVQKSAGDCEKLLNVRDHHIKDLSLKLANQTTSHETLLVKFDNDASTALTVSSSLCRLSAHCTELGRSLINLESALIDVPVDQHSSDVLIFIQSCRGWWEGVHPIIPIEGLE